MPKQVFEFTDKEISDILFKHIADEPGSIPVGRYSTTLTVIATGRKNFTAQLRLELLTPSLT